MQYISRYISSIISDPTEFVKSDMNNLKAMMLEFALQSNQYAVKVYNRSINGMGLSLILSQRRKAFLCNY